jgi:hypothetical protein
VLFGSRSLKKRYEKINTTCAVRRGLGMKQAGVIGVGVFSQQAGEFLAAALIC